MEYNYGYEDFTYITTEDLLKKISQQEIFEWILGEPFEFGKLYKSPLREDTHKGCRFEQNNEMILWVDFGDTPTHRTCFGLVMAYFKLPTLTMALQEIIKNFKITSNTPDKYTSINTTKEYKEKVRASITYKTKPYTSKDFRFWNLVGITTEHLREDLVYSASYITIDNPNKKKVSFTPRSLCYVIDFLDAVVVYQPYNSDYKFIKNTNENHVGNFDNLDAVGDTLIIAKAYKDHRIFRNFGYKNTIWFMSESIIPSLPILENLCKRFKKIVVFYDNDSRGIKFGQKLVDLLNSIEWYIAELMYIPFEYKCKDLGELLPKEGAEDTLKILKQLGL